MTLDPSWEEQSKNYNQASKQQSYMSSVSYITVLQTYFHWSVSLTFTFTGSLLEHQINYSIKVRKDFTALHFTHIYIFSEEATNQSNNWKDLRDWNWRGFDGCRATRWKKEMMDGAVVEEMTDCVKSSIGNRCITTNDLLREIFICQNHIVCTQIICSWCQKHPETKQSWACLQNMSTIVSKLKISVDSILPTLPG